MEGILIILVCAVVIEALIEVLKGMVPDTVAVPTALWPIVAAVLGVVLCIAASVDLLATAGLNISVPYMGSIMTGVLISRGASFIHDVWNRITENKIAE